MSSTILYGYWRSSATYRTRIALNLKGIEYEYVAVDLRTEEHLGAAFRAGLQAHFLPQGPSGGQLAMASRHTKEPFA